MFTVPAADVCVILENHKKLLLIDGKYVYPIGPCGPAPPVAPVAPFRTLKVPMFAPSPARVTLYKLYAKESPLKVPESVTAFTAEPVNPIGPRILAVAGVAGAVPVVFSERVQLIFPDPSTLGKTV